MGFAVVIPAFNHQATVVDTVRSALDQTGVEEVIVVDDGSTDDTASVAAAIVDPRFRLLRQANAGPSSARNTGARAATSAHLVFLDADDQLLPDSIAVFASRLDGECRLVRSGAIRVSPAGSAQYLAIPSERPYPRGAPLAGTFSIERGLFESIGGYDEQLRYGENTELLLRAHMGIIGAGDGVVSYTGEPTVRVMANAAHDTEHYRRRRLEAIEKMLQVHGGQLRADREILHAHHAVAANLYRQGGLRDAAREHAWEALRVRPWAPRSWVRFVRTLAPVSGRAE